MMSCKKSCYKMLYSGPCLHIDRILFCLEYADEFKKHGACIVHSFISCNDAVCRDCDDGDYQA